MDSLDKGSQFDYQPILIGDLVKLRPLAPGDFDDLYAVASDPLIWEQHPVRNRHEKTVFRAFFTESIESGGALTAIDVESNVIIGSSRFHDFSAKRSEVEIGWTFLARAYWGGLYNGEIKRLMLDHAFQFVDRVILLVGPDNVRSQRAVEKIGGSRVGMRPDTGGRDSWMYAIDANRFNLSRNHE